MDLAECISIGAYAVARTYNVTYWIKGVLQSRNASHIGQHQIMEVATGCWKGSAPFFLYFSV